MKTRPGFALIIALLVAAACNSKMESSEVAGLSEATASATTVSQAADVVSDLYSNGITKLIKTANYRFEVDNVQKSIDAIEVAMRKYNAFISSSALRLDNPIIESKMTIRVQNEYFQELLKEIDKQA